MVRIIYILIILSVNFAWTQDIIIQSHSVDNYPEISVDAFFYDNNELVDITKDDLRLFENNAEITEFSISCNSSGVYEPGSYIISLDISQSMKGFNADFAKNIIKPLINKILSVNENSEILIQGFSNSSYVIHDFSSDLNSLYDALDNYTNTGFTDFNAAFIEENTGALYLAQNAKYDPSVILISDGKARANVSDIINAANDTKIFTITLSNNTPNELIQIVRNTNGKYFSDIDLESEIDVTVNDILFLSSEYEPCRITYNSENCELNKEITIKTPDNELSTFINVPVSKFTFIDFPENNFLKYEEQGQVKSLKLKAVNDDIFITSIEPDNSNFSIINNITNYTLRKDSTIELNIRYNSSNDNFKITEFSINSDICFGTNFWCSAGEDITDTKTIRVISPNGGEVYQAKTDTIIKWAGVSPGDTVSVEISSNNGQTWNKISNRIFAGLESKILLPDINSDECLLRIKQISNNLMDEDIHIFEEHESQIIDLKFSNDGNYLFSADLLGKIIRWDTETFTLDSVFFENLNSLNDFDIDGSGLLLAYSLGEPKINVYNIASGNTDIQLLSAEGIIKKFEWQKNGNLIAGLSNNKLLFWEYPNPNTVKILSNDDYIFTDIRFSNKSDELIISTFEGNVLIVDLDSYTISEDVKVSDYEINSIVFGPSDKNIVFGANNEEFSVWNPFTDTKLKSYIDENTSINLIDWSTVNSTIATANNNSQIKLWSLSDFKEFFTYNYHQSSISALKWSPENNYLASGDENGTIHIWSLSDLPFENKPVQMDTSDNVFSIKIPKLALKNVSFAPIFINERNDTIVKNIITNTGDINIMIDSVKIIGKNSSSFELGNTFPNHLKTDTTYDLKLIFKPEVINDNKANIVIYSGINTFVSELFGIAFPKVVDGEINKINFNEVNLYSVKDTTINVLRNISGKNVNIKNVELLNNNSQFNIENYSTSVNNDEFLSLTLSYVPENLTNTGDILKISLDNNYDLYITVIGRGVAPFVSYPDSLDFGDLRCNELSIDSILTSINSGTNFLKIDSVKILGSNSFTVDALASDFIDVGKSLNLSVKFEPVIKGAHMAELKVYTNYLQNYENEISIHLKGFLDSIDLRFNKYDVNLENLNKNQVYYDTIIVENQGTRSVEFQSVYFLGLFEVKPEKISLHVNESMKFYITFLGSSDEGQYREILKYIDYCGNETQLVLNAVIGNSSAVIETVQSIELLETSCGEPKEYKLEILNSGLTDLILYDLYFIDNKFRIKENTENITIKNSNSEVFTIVSNELINGMNKSDLIIETNAENSISGIVKIPVLQQNNYSFLEFESDTVYFLNALDNINYIKYINVKNSGNIDFNFEDDYETEHFIVKQITPDIISEQDEALLEVEFKSGEVGNKYLEYFDFIDSCGNVYRLYLYADVNGYAQAGLKTGSFTASIGDTIEIPIYVYSPENVDLPNVEGYSADILLNANVLYPLFDTPESFIDNEIRTISINNINNEQVQNIPAISLKFLVTLGDTNKTDLIIQNARAINKPSISVETQNGDVTIDGYCESGGDRFIDYTGILYLGQNAPNPADKSTSITFNLIEKGYYKLELFDIKGNKLKDIDEGYSDTAINRTVTVDLTSLAIGNYLYVLTTPSKTIVKKLTVKR